MTYCPSGLRGLLGIGGAEVSTRRLMESLRKRGIESSMVVFGYRCIPTGWVADYPIHFITPHTEPRWHKPRSWASLGRSVVQFYLAMRCSGSSILHVQGAGNGIIAPALAARLPRRWKMVVTLRGSDIRINARQDPVHRRRLAHLLRQSDAITAVSMELADNVADLYGDSVPSLYVIPNGVEPFWFEPSENIPAENYVLFVGRLHPVKGLDYLLEAWKLLRRRCRRMPQLWLVGEGPERENLEKMAREEGISDSVRFWGAVQDMEQLKALYSGARALVLPSRSEGLGNVLLEAGACGTICIGSDVGGIPEVIVDGETGFLFPPGDVESLARTIQYVLEMPAGECQRMSGQAQQRIAEHFSLQKVVEQYINVYKQVTGKARCAQPDTAPQ